MTDETVRFSSFEKNPAFLEQVRGPTSLGLVMRDSVRDWLLEREEHERVSKPDFKGLVAKRRENSTEMRDEYGAMMTKLLLQKAESSPEMMKKVYEHAANTVAKAEDLTIVEPAGPEPLGGSEVENDEDDATQDIVEVNEITEEAMDAVNFLFKKVENRAEKIRLDMLETGGVFVTFRHKPNAEGVLVPEYKLNIHADGARFGLKNMKTGEIQFFTAMTKKDLRKIIYDILDVPILDALSEAKQEVDISTTAAPLTIKLKKGFSREGLREFIKQVDKVLQMRNEKGLTTTVRVTTDEWHNDVRPFMCIPAAKRMFSRFAEAGLLASLAFNNFIDAAKEVYCVAYVKGKEKDGKVEFTNINPEDFRVKLMSSAENLAKICDDGDEESSEEEN